ncbi:unnamed protein product, partial [Chrysoparadoxa australica]
MPRQCIACRPSAATLARASKEEEQMMRDSLEGSPVSHRGSKTESRRSHRSSKSESRSSHRSSRTTSERLGSSQDQGSSEHRGSKTSKRGSERLRASINARNAYRTSAVLTAGAGQRTSFQGALSAARQAVGSQDAGAGSPRLSSTSGTAHGGDSGRSVSR